MHLYVKKKKKKIFSVPLFLPSMQMLVDIVKGIGFSPAKMHSAEDEAREVDRQRSRLPCSPWEGEILSSDRYILKKTT